MAVDFTRLNTRTRDKFGNDCTFTPDGGEARTVRVVVDQDYFADTGGVGIQTEKVAVQGCISDFEDLAVGDVFAFALDELTGNFKVVEVQSDFKGFVTCILNKTV